MDPSTRKQSILEEIVAIFEKSNKVIGLIAAIIAAITFSTGNNLLSYISVVVAYIGFTSFFVSRIFAQKEEPAILTTKGETITKKVPIYSMSSRLIYGAITLLMTAGVVSWLGINLWSDYRLSQSNLYSNQQPVTSSPSNGLGNSPSGGQSSNEAAFAQEQISVYSCIYGIPKTSNSNDIWEIIVDKSGKVQTTGEPQTVSDVPEVVVKALFLTPKPTVVDKMYIEVEELSPPTALSELDLKVSPGCLVGGGGPIEIIKFEPVEINSSQDKYELTFKNDGTSAKLPYRLDSYDALVISVPLKPTESGLYVFHITAVVVDFSGSTKEISSHMLRYGLLQTTLSELSKQEIVVP